MPVVFAQSVDPVGNGFVDSMAQPGGNTTGFIQFEYSLAGKRLELLKEIVPGTARTAIIWDPATYKAANTDFPGIAKLEHMQ